MANEDKAARYHRLRRVVSLAGTALGALLLLLLVVTGGSATIRDFALALAGRSLFLTVIAYVVVVALVNEAVQLPLVYYLGLTLERRYGLSLQTARGWWLDQLKAGGVGLALAVAGALMVSYFLRWSPEFWWVLAAGCSATFLVLLAQLGPVLLLPLFYEFKPLDRLQLTGRLAVLANAPGYAYWACSSGVSAIGRARRTRRWLGSAARGAFWFPTRCSPATVTRKSK